MVTHFVSRLEVARKCFIPTQDGSAGQMPFPALAGRVNQ